MLTQAPLSQVWSLTYTVGAEDFLFLVLFPLYRDPGLLAPMHFLFCSILPIVLNN